MNITFNKIASALAFLIGAMAIFAGGQVLLGKDPGYHVINWLLLIPAAVIIKLLGDPQTVAAWEQLDKSPSILMLVMAISGTYLFLLPYIVKGQRKKKAAPEVAETSAVRR